MKDEESSSTDVRDFGEILGTSLGGRLPLLVGGHAVHLWALAYRHRLVETLAKWFPLTSKDLDLYGTLELLEALKREFGGEYRLSGPRSPVVGQLVVKLGGVDRKIDVLRDVVGLTAAELSKQGYTLDFEVDGTWLKGRVLPVVTLLQAKVANLATLDQARRNDEKHVNILLPLVREHLVDLIEAAESGSMDSRGVIAPMEQARGIIASRWARKCSSDFGVDFDRIWPRESLQTAQDPRIQNFVKHRLPPATSDPADTDSSPR